MTYRSHDLAGGAARDHNELGWPFTAPGSLPHLCEYREEDGEQLLWSLPLFFPLVKMVVVGYDFIFYFGTLLWVVYMVLGVCTMWWLLCFPFGLAQLGSMNGGDWAVVVPCVIDVIDELSRQRLRGLYGLRGR